MTDNENFIPPFGNYADLLSYQKAEVVYDLTFRFCQRFLAKGDRTIDQMTQAARSGKQNIVEASKASGTSKEMEIKLTNVARASLEELRLDYEDFLRQRNLPKWDAFNPRNADLIARRPKTAEDFAKWTKEIHDCKFNFDKVKSPKMSSQSISSIAPAPTYPEITANGALALIAVACSLLDRQLKAQSKTFLSEGGFTERLHRTRSQSRTRRP